MKPLNLSSVDISRLKKTSVDFTLCDEDDSPILCIEFDGLQQGFNVGQSYHPTTKPPDTWRQIIMGLKLKVALGSSVPFVVVASDNFEDIAGDVKLTIVDGIIGQVLSIRNAAQIIGKGFDPTEVGYSDDDFDNLSEYERQDIIQNWVIAVEVDSDFENNPIVRKRAQLEHDLGVHEYGIEYFCYPSLNTAQTLEGRASLMETALYNGAKVIIKTQDLGEVIGTAMIPNFKTIGFTGSLAEEIAGIFALERIKNLRKKTNSKKIS